MQISYNLIAAKTNEIAANIETLVKYQGGRKALAEKLGISEQAVAVLMRSIKQGKAKMSTYLKLEQILCHRLIDVTKIDFYNLSQT